MGKKKTKSPPRPRPVLVALRYGVRLLPPALLLIGAIVLFQQVESFLIRDARFALGSADKDFSAAPDIRIRHLTHASRSRILRVFEKDAGRSLYLFPVEERRRQLLAVDWVKDASVSRIWPNRVDVTIRERVPVAFVQLPSGRGRPSRVALIDEDGVILKPPPRVRYDLPVLTGIREKQSEKTRALRVRRAMRLMREVGELGSQISEIDVSKPDKLTITENAGGKAVVLILGRERFRSRLENFLRHYPEIRRQLPTVTTFDLQLDDRITALDAVTGKPLHPKPTTIASAAPVPGRPASRSAGGGR